MTSRKGKPTSRFTDATRPLPVRGCICEGGPFIVATFRNQAVISVTREHRSYCAESGVALDIFAYVSRGEKVPA